MSCYFMENQVAEVRDRENGIKICFNKLPFRNEGATITWGYSGKKNEKTFPYADAPTIIRLPFEVKLWTLACNTVEECIRWNEVFKREECIHYPVVFGRVRCTKKTNDTSMKSIEAFSPAMESLTAEKLNNFAGSFWTSNAQYSVCSDAGSPKQSLRRSFSNASDIRRRSVEGSSGNGQSFGKTRRKRRAFVESYGGWIEAKDDGSVEMLFPDGSIVSHACDSTIEYKSASGEVFTYFNGIRICDSNLSRELRAIISQKVSYYNDAVRYLD